MHGDPRGVSDPEPPAVGAAAQAVTLEGTPRVGGFTSMTLKGEGEDGGHRGWEARVAGTLCPVNFGATSDWFIRGAPYGICLGALGRGTWLPLCSLSSGDRGQWAGVWEMKRQLVSLWVCGEKGQQEMGWGGAM